MDTERFTQHLADDIVAMSSAARQSGFGADVPSCPGWDVRDLIIHTGVVHRHKTTTLAGDHQDGPAPLPETPGDAMSDVDVLSWFDEGGAGLLEACAHADLSEPSWTWCPHDHAKQWWVRRMAHETVIHRVDAQIALGVGPSVDSWLATDGIDEILDEFVVGGPSWSTVTPTDRVVRIATGDRSWTLRTAVLSGTSPHSGRTYEALDTLVHDDAEPSATLTADPEALDLWLWGRGDLPNDAITGDASLVAHLRSVAAGSTG